MKTESEFRVESKGGVISVRGEIDANTAPMVLAAIDAHDATELTIDLSSTSFIDSSGLKAFSTASRRGKSIRMINVAPSVRRVIELTGLAEVFGIR